MAVDKAKVPKALLFDVFGTAVDWRSTVLKALQDAAKASLDDSARSLPDAVRTKADQMTDEVWDEFADKWRATYLAFTKKLALDPSVQWKSVDQHYLDALNEFTADYGIEGLWTPDEVQKLSLIWHYLGPWSDSVAGIEALNRSFATATLTNGNIALINDLKAYSGIPFTHVFSAEMFKSYKPSPKVYQGAAEKLGLQASECGLVAAHLGDLKAAKAAGYGYAVYVARPREEDWSQEQIDEARTAGWIDLWVDENENGFLTVADKLGAR